MPEPIKPRRRGAVDDEEEDFDDDSDEDKAEKAAMAAAKARTDAMEKAKSAANADVNARAAVDEYYSVGAYGKKKAKLAELASLACSNSELVGKKIE